MTYFLIVVVLVVLIVSFKCFAIVLVSGDSMYPTLKNGDILFATTLKLNELKAGDVIVFKRERGGSAYIKRIASILTTDRDYYYVLGDNSEVSYDSRNYGYINRECIIAKIVPSKQKKEVIN